MFKTLFYLCMCFIALLLLPIGCCTTEPGNTETELHAGIGALDQGQSGVIAASGTAEELRILAERAAQDEAERAAIVIEDNRAAAERARGITSILGAIQDLARNSLDEFNKRPEDTKGP